MSFLVKLPDLLLVDILRNWSSSKNLSRLDSAFTNNRTRHILLNLFRSNVFTLETLPRNYHRWINFRCIKIESLSLIGQLALNEEFEPILNRAKSIKLTDYRRENDERFVQTINKCTNINSLIVNKAECLDSDAWLLIDRYILHQLMTVKITNCMRCFDTPTAVGYFAKQTGNITDLCLTRCNLWNGESLNVIFESNNHLSVVSIYDAPTGDSQVQTLLSYCHNTLTRIVFHNYVFDNSMDTIVRLLDKCKSLQYLHLTDSNRNTHESHSIFYEANSKATTPKYEPGINYNDLYGDKTAKVSKTNAELDPINRALLITGNVGANRDHFYQLFSSVESARSLNTLHIDGNGGGGEINGSILSLIAERNPNLYEFQLTNCDSKTLADGLSDIMWQCQRLQDLRLKNCDVSNKDLSGLLGIPNVLLKLTLVGLSTLNIDTVRSIIQSNPQLRKLYLQDCVSSGDLDYLYEYIKDNRLRVDINDHRKDLKEAMENAELAWKM